MKLCYFWIPNKWPLMKKPFNRKNLQIGICVYNMVLANDNYISKIYFGAPLDKIFATYIQ